MSGMTLPAELQDLIAQQNDETAKGLMALLVELRNAVEVAGKRSVTDQNMAVTLKRIEELADSIKAPSRRLRSSLSRLVARVRGQDGVALASLVTCRSTTMKLSWR